MHFKEYITATGMATFFMFARFLYYPVLAPYMRSSGLNDFQIGLILGVFGLVVFFTAPIIGHFSDKIGRRAIMLFGMIASILSIVLYIIDDHWITFLLGRGLMAIGFVAVVIVGIARVEDHIGNKNRGQYSGWSFTLMDTARIFAPPLGGLLADYYFVKFPFLVAIIVIMLICAYLLLLEQRPIRQRISKTDLNLVKILRNFMMNKNLRGMGFLGMAIHASIPIQAMFIPILIKNTWGMPYRYVGYAMFAYMAPHLLQFALGKFADRIGSAKGVALGTGLYGLTLLLLSQAHDYVSLIIWLVVLGLWGGLWNVSAWSFMSYIGERKHQEGEVVCSYTSWAKLGSFASFAIGGLFVMHIGLSYFMILIGSVILIMTFITYPMLTYKQHGRKRA